MKTVRRLLYADVLGAIAFVASAAYTHTLDATRLPIKDKDVGDPVGVVLDQIRRD